MKANILAVSAIFLLSGCTTLRYPIATTSCSSVEQELLWQSMEHACGSLFSYSPEEELFLVDKLEAIQKIIDRKETTWEGVAISAREAKGIREELRQSLKEMRENKSVAEAFMRKKVFLDVQGIPALFPMCTNIMEDVLGQRDMKVVSTEKDADLRLKVIVKVNGVDEKHFWFPVFYRSDTMEARTEMRAMMTELSTGNKVYENVLRGSSHFTRGYILEIFGPVNMTSLDR